MLTLKSLWQRKKNENCYISNTRSFCIPTALVKCKYINITSTLKGIIQYLFNMVLEEDKSNLGCRNNLKWQEYSLYNLFEQEPVAARTEVIYMHVNIYIC